MLHRKPLITVLEPDAGPQRGGLTREAIVAMLTTACYRAINAASNAPADQSWVSHWRLDDEIKQWGFSSPPTGEAIALALFAGACIEWNRLSAFQDVTMRLIAERVLPIELQGAVYVQGEVGSGALKSPPLTHGRRYNLYCSRHNQGARELGIELRQLLHKRRQPLCKPCRSALLPTTDEPAELHRCEHMLVYLTSTTWTSDEESAAFAHEICEAHRLGVPLLLVHEIPSMIENEDEMRRACEFNDFWNEGWTPQHLLVGDANVYRQIALGLKPGEWRIAGLMAVLQKMRDSGGAERAPIHVDEPDWKESSPKSRWTIQRFRSSAARRLSGMLDGTRNNFGPSRRQSSLANGEEIAPAPTTTTTNLFVSHADGRPHTPPFVSYGNFEALRRGDTDEADALSPTRRQHGPRVAITSHLAGKHLRKQRPLRVSSGQNAGGMISRAHGGTTNHERRSHLGDLDEEVWEEAQEEPREDAIGAPLPPSTALERLQARRAQGESIRRSQAPHLSGTSEAPPSFRAARRSDYTQRRTEAIGHSGESSSASSVSPRRGCATGVRSMAPSDSPSAGGDKVTTGFKGASPPERSAEARRKWQSSLPLARALPPPAQALSSTKPSLPKEVSDVSSMGPPTTMAGASARALRGPRLSLSGSQMQRANAQGSCNSEPHKDSSAVDAAGAAAPLPSARCAVADRRSPRSRTMMLGITAREMRDMEDGASAALADGSGAAFAERPPSARRLLSARGDRSQPPSIVATADRIAAADTRDPRLSLPGSQMQRANAQGSCNFEPHKNSSAVDAAGAAAPLPSARCAVADRRSPRSRTMMLGITAREMRDMEDGASAALADGSGAAFAERPPSARRLLSARGDRSQPPSIVATADRTAAADSAPLASPTTALGASGQNNGCLPPERADMPHSTEASDCRSLQLGFRASRRLSCRRRSSVGLDGAAPQLSPAVLEDDWGVERTFEEYSLEDTHGDMGDGDASAAARPKSTRPRLSANGVLGSDGKFAPPRVRI